MNEPPDSFVRRGTAASSRTELASIVSGLHRGILSRTQDLCTTIETRHHRRHPLNTLVEQNVGTKERGWKPQDIPIIIIHWCKVD
jgi:hypothetical protein